MGFFAYIHCRPDGSPFYVGKGARRRAVYMGERNPHHKAIVAKYGPKAIQVAMMECSTERLAFNLERGIIKCLRRSGVALANFTAGGEGGSNPEPETRKRLSEAAKKRGVSAACQEAKVLAKRGKPISDEQRIKQRLAMTGRVFTSEHRANISKSAKLRGMPRSVIDKCIAANTGRIHSKEERERRSKALIAMWDAKGRKPKPPKGPKKSCWATRKTHAIFVDDVFYPSIKAASVALGIHSSNFVAALKRSGVTKGHRVREASHGV